MFKGFLWKSSKCDGASSNVLEILTVVFSSAQQHLLLFITHRMIKASCPLFIAFAQCGPGHYSAVCAVDDTSVPEVPLSGGSCSGVDSRCSCGQNNRQSTKQHCIEIRHYNG